MDEYLQNIPDSELISITRDFLIENGILDQPFGGTRGTHIISTRVRFILLIMRASYFHTKGE